MHPRCHGPALHLKELHCKTLLMSNVVVGTLGQNDSLVTKRDMPVVVIL